MFVKSSKTFHVITVIQYMLWSVEISDYLPLPLPAVMYVFYGKFFTNVVKRNVAAFSGCAKKTSLECCLLSKIGSLNTRLFSTEKKLIAHHKFLQALPHQGKGSRAKSKTFDAHVRTVEGEQ